MARNNVGCVHRLSHQIAAVVINAIVGVAFLGFPQMTCSSDDKLQQINVKDKQSCNLKAFILSPRKARHSDQAIEFVGGGSVMLVIVKDESTSSPGDIFPEPPLTVQNIKLRKKCQIDGGIWVNGQMYLSQDEKTLVLFSYAGSSGYLDFYKTGNCRQFAHIDVSGESKVEPNRIIYEGVCGDGFCEGAGCECRPATIHLLNSQCSPILDEMASYELTKTIYGVGFKNKSVLDYPKTDKAKLSN